MNADNLMGLFRAGNPEAFNTVYKMFFKPISYFAQGITKNEEEGKDIAIDSFLELWKIHDRFVTVGNVKAFLFITAKNACIDFLKHQKRRKISYREWANFSNDWEPEYLQTIIEAEIFSELRAEVEKLPLECKKVFKMIYYDGKSLMKLQPN